MRTPTTIDRSPGAVPLFRALADRTRLRILHLLREQEYCVGDLVGVLGVPQPTASRHLSYLRRAGLVRTRRQGAWIHYRLAEPEGEFRERLLAAAWAAGASVEEVAADAARATVLGDDGGCCP